MAIVRYLARRAFSPHFVNIYYTAERLKTKQKNGEKWKKMIFSKSEKMGIFQRNSAFRFSTQLRRAAFFFPIVGRKRREQKIQKKQIFRKKVGG